MEHDNLKRINIVIVVAYLIGSLFASLGFAFTDATLLFIVETILGLIIYIFGVIAAYRNYKRYHHKTLLILMTAGILFSISLIALIIQTIVV